MTDESLLHPAQVDRSVRAASMSAFTRQPSGGAAAAFGLPTPQQQRDALLGPHRASTRRPSLPPLPPRHVRRSSCSASEPLRTHSGPMFSRPGPAAAVFASPDDRQQVGSMTFRW